MDNIKNFGPNLRSEIQKKGYKTYKKAADAFGISLSYLNQLMRNEREPSLELLTYISEVLSIQPGKLLGDSQEVRLPESEPDRASLILEIQSRINRFDMEQLTHVSDSLDQIESLKSNISSLSKDSLKNK